MMITSENLRKLADLYEAQEQGKRIKRLGSSVINPWADETLVFYAHGEIKEYFKDIEKDRFRIVNEYLTWDDIRELRDNETPIQIVKDAHLCVITWYDEKTNKVQILDKSIGTTGTRFVTKEDLMDFINFKTGKRLSERKTK